MNDDDDDAHPMHRFLGTTPLDRLFFFQIAGDGSTDFRTEVVYCSQTGLTASRPPSSASVSWER